MPLGYDSRLTSTLITGLMAAARRGDVAAVRALLSRGASVHLKDRYVVVEGRIVWGVCAEGRVCGAAWRAVKVVVLGVVWGFCLCGGSRMGCLYDGPLGGRMGGGGSYGAVGSTD